jgi:hypothetical protein
VVLGFGASDETQREFLALLGTVAAWPLAEGRNELLAWKLKEQPAQVTAA